MRIEEYQCSTFLYTYIHIIALQNNINSSIASAHFKEKGVVKPFGGLSKVGSDSAPVVLVLFLVCVFSQVQSLTALA